MIVMTAMMDENDDLMTSRHGGGRPRIFSAEDDLYCGLVLCEGHSQRSAPFLNGVLDSVAGEVRG